MIFAWSGKTGSGKTINMVWRALMAWKDGQNIWSNTILHFYPKGYNIRKHHTISEYPELFSLYERLKWRLQLKLGIPPAKEPCRGAITYFEEINDILHVHNGVILFDEAQRLFNAKHWQSLPEDFADKLQQHRKDRLDLYCTAQNLKTVDITYRRLVQSWAVCKAGGRIFPFVPIRIHYLLYKDPDEIQNDNVDETKARTIGVHKFYIHPWLPKLYETLFKVGYRRFKTTWTSRMLKDEQGKRYRQRSWIMYPKRMKVSDALAALRSSELLYSRAK